MSDPKALRAAIADTEPPPCIKPARCRHYDACAAQRLACNLFLRYVYRGAGQADRTPTRATYERIFSGKDSPLVNRRQGSKTHKRSVTDATLRRVLQWHQDGMDCQAIAAELHRSKKTVRGWLRKLTSGVWVV